MDNENLKPPRKDWADNTHEYGRDVAKALTLGLANPLVDFILPSFHQKRFEDWCANVFKALLELSENKISLEDLRQNEEFISLLKESMVIASKTHQEEKHEFLKRALLNQFESPYTFDEKIIYTRLIDSLTLTHIYFLCILSKCADELKNMNRFSDMVERLAKDELADYVPTESYRMLLKDLENSSLIELSESIEYEDKVRQATYLKTKEEDNELPFILITEHGNSFLDYIVVENK